MNIYSFWIVPCFISSRKLREILKSLTDETKIMTYVTTFRDGLWPGGKLADAAPPRTMDEKLRTKEEANRKLSALVPGKVFMKRSQNDLLF